MKIKIENSKNNYFQRKGNSTLKGFSKTKILLIFFLFIVFIKAKKQIKDNSNKKGIKNININEHINMSINLNISNYINIAVNFDNKYIYPCITFLTSLLDNRADSTFYIIHILTGTNLRNDTYYKISSVIEKFGKKYCNVSFYDMGEQFKGATAGKYIVKLLKKLPLNNSSQ